MWLAVYILTGTLIMMGAGSSLTDGDIVINVFVRVISIVCWPVLVLFALISIYKENKKEDETKMIAYVCDDCEKVIPKDSERYLLKSIKASNHYTDPVVICLCESCKDKWAEKVPELFEFSDILERRH